MRLLAGAGDGFVAIGDHLGMNSGEKRWRFEIAGGNQLSQLARDILPERI